MLDLIWEPEARHQYAAIVDFVSEHNPRAALRLSSLIDEALERACRFPEIGRPGRVSGTRELIVHPNYLIVYQVAAGAIDVLRLLHARQRYP